MNLIKSNEVITISSIIIIYEILILLFYLLKIINKKTSQNLLSWAVVLNFFIIFVMFLTDCKIDTKVKLLIVSIKTLLLFFVLLIANFSITNYFIGLSFLIIYYIFSDINKVYSCNVKMKNLLLSFMFSSIIYIILVFNQYYFNKKLKN